jgi:hypothetical protein
MLPRVTSEGHAPRRTTLHLLCIGAAVEILNLLDADGADHTYTTEELTAVIYKNITCNDAVLTGLG